MIRTIPISLLISIGCLLVIENAFTQIILESRINPRDIRKDFINVAEGKVAPDIHCLLEDHNGYLWMATGSTLHKYDGYQWENCYNRHSYDSIGFIGSFPQCIFEDSDGMIWMGTLNALNMFNPLSKKFRYFIFDTINPEGPNNIVGHISEDSQGVLWFMTRGNVFAYNKRTDVIKEYILPAPVFLEYTHMHQYGGASRFLEDSEGYIWVPTCDGIAKYSVKEDRFEIFHIPPSERHKPGPDTITHIMEDNDGRIWFGTKGEGLFKMVNKETGESARFNFDIENIYQDYFFHVEEISVAKDGSLWVAGDACFTRIDLQSGSSQSYILDSRGNFREHHLYLNRIFHDPSGSVIFIHYYHGIFFKFDPSGHFVYVQQTPRYLALDCIQDRSGAYWMGTLWMTSAVRFDLTNKPIMSWDLNDLPGWSMNHYSPAELFEDSQGTRWVVGAERIYHFKHNVFYNPYITEFLPFTFQDGTDIAHRMIKGIDENLWFLHDEYVIRKYDPVEHSSELFDIHKLLDGIELETTNISRARMAQDKRGQVWLLTLEKQLIKLEPETGSAKLYPIAGEESKVVPVDLFIDRTGIIWIAAFGGACRFDPLTERIKWFRNIPGDPSSLWDNAINRVREDRDGNLWFLSFYSGLYRFIHETEQFEHIQQKGEMTLYSDFLWALDSSLWIAGYKRIIKYFPGTDAIKEINLDDGDGEYRFSQLTTGEITAFSDWGNMNIFPVDLGLNPAIPPVRISGLRINDVDYMNYLEDPVELSKVQKIELKHSQNYLQFEFVALNYLEPGRNRYRYRMFGADLDTVEAGTNRTASYSNLRQGKYTFWVTGSNNDGIWNPEGASLEIHILPPWYSTGLAYLMYGLLALACIYLLLRWRTWRLRVEKEKLASLVRERTRTIEQQKEELQITLDNLQKTQIQLIQSEKLAALGGLVAGVAHEINTPVGISVTAASSLAEETQAMADKYKQNKISRAEFKDYLNTANQSAKLILSNMERTAMMVQSFKQVSVDQSTEQKRIFKLKEYSEDVFRSLYPKLKGKKIDVLLDIDETLELDSYPGAYSQILTNLVLNSLVHGFDDKDEGIIRLSAQLLDGELNINYSDDGRGILESNISKIFDPFYSTDKKSGTGLGLHIVYNLVSQKLRGTITCSSEKENGATFQIKIPL